MKVKIRVLSQKTLRVSRKTLLVYVNVLVNDNVLVNENEKVNGNDNDDETENVIVNEDANV